MSSIPKKQRNWESWLVSASGPASPTEEQQRDRTESRIRKAIAAAPDLPSSVAVYVKGSYANGTNVRGDADVDIAVEWRETAKVKKWGRTAGMNADQLGYVPVTEPVSPSILRARVERAMIEAFGSKVDTEPSKHIGVTASSSTLDADVVPCFELHRYDAPYDYHAGHRIFPKDGGSPVDNYPRQNYDNSVAKNSATDRRYKQIVRCIKRIIGELYADGYIGRDYPGYLIESLVYNTPSNRFGHTRRYDDVQSVFSYLWNGLKDPDVYNDWTEPSELQMLFRGRRDRLPSNALEVIDRAWDRIGGPI